MKAFGIEHTWQVLSRISGDIGASRVSLENDFLNFARARNRAAHDGNGNVPTSDLKTFAETAMLVGICVDIALSNSIDCLVAGSTLSSALTAANSAAVAYRFIDQDPKGGWGERASAQGRTIKLYATRDAAKRGAVARKGKFVIIVRDQRQLPIEVL